MQNRAVFDEPVLDIVFSYLTPAQYHRYISHNLCQALSSRGRIVVQFHRGGTLLVNQADSSRFLLTEGVSSSLQSWIFPAKHPLTVFGPMKEFSVA
ncbi:MAG TPA: hypothetical protein VGF44_06380 [Terriglobales bacterium]